MPPKDLWGYNDGPAWNNPLRVKKGFRQEKTSKHRKQKRNQKRK